MQIKPRGKYWLLAIFLLLLTERAGAAERRTEESLNRRFPALSALDLKISPPSADPLSISDKTSPSAPILHSSAALRRGDWERNGLDPISPQTAWTDRFPRSGKTWNRRPSELNWRGRESNMSYSVTPSERALSELLWDHRNMRIEYRQP